MLIVIPAAGASSRMRGRDKLLELVDYQPLLAQRIAVALETGADVLVTLPPNNPERRAIAEGIVDDRLDLVIVDDAAEGMAASIRAAATFAQQQDADALMLVLADMPEIDVNDLRTMMRAFDSETVMRGMDTREQPGHPVLFPARLFPALAEVSGDQGARDVLADEKVVMIPLPDCHATTDLDTPEDWAAWRGPNSP